MPDDLEAQRFAARSQRLADRADPDDDQGLAREQPLPPALPASLALICQHSREIAGQRHHEEDGELRHLRPVNPARRGHDD